MNEKTIGFRGSPVRLLSSGTGEPLLYLHGSGDSGDWLPAHTELAESYTVYRPDLAGFNGSARRDDVTSVAELAEWVWGLADELALGDVRIVGSSLGGWVAAQLATTQPSRVSHLVLFDAVGLLPPGGPLVDQFSMTPAELVEAVYFSDSLRQKVSAAAAGRRKDPVVAARMAGNAEMTRTLGEHPYFHDPSLADRLADVTAKTMIVWGEDDGLVPTSVGRLYEELIHGASLHVMAGCGHLPLIEREKDTLHLIVPFLAG